MASRACYVGDDHTVLVGAKGFEPSTPRSRTVCATRLRYAPITHHTLYYIFLQNGKVKQGITQTAGR
jgi:hypothetical protein